MIHGRLPKQETHHFHGGCPKRLISRVIASGILASLVAQLMQRDELGRFQLPALTPRLRMLVESRDGIAFVHDNLGDFGIEVEATSLAYLKFLNMVLHVVLQMGMRKKPG